MNKLEKQISSWCVKYEGQEGFDTVLDYINKYYAEGEPMRIYNMQGWYGINIERNKEFSFSPFTFVLSLEQFNNLICQN